MKATAKDIIPGRIFFYVSCICGTEAHSAHLSSKIIIKNKPYIDQYNIGLKFDSIDDYRPYGFDWEHTTAEHFLASLGIGTVYNLHRLFTTEESALAYVEECKTGKFTDPVDQKYYDATCTSDYAKYRKEMLEDLYSLSNSIYD